MAKVTKNKTLWRKICDWEYWYIVWRIVLFPIWLITLIAEKYREQRKENMFWTKEKGWKWLDKNLPKRIKNERKQDGSFLIKRLNHKHDLYHVPDFSIVDWESIISSRDYDFLLKFKPQIITLLFKEYQIDGYKKYLSTNPGFYSVSGVPTDEHSIDKNNKPTMIFFKKIKK